MRREKIHFLVFFFENILLILKERKPKNVIQKTGPGMWTRTIFEFIAELG